MNPLFSGVTNSCNDHLTDYLCCHYVFFSIFLQHISCLIFFVLSPWVIFCNFVNVYLTYSKPHISRGTIWYILEYHMHETIITIKIINIFHPQKLPHVPLWAIPPSTHTHVWTVTCFRRPPISFQTAECYRNGILCYITFCF